MKVAKWSLSITLLLVIILAAIPASAAKKDTLRIDATSDDPTKSVTLTVWANYETGSVNLGELKYWVPGRIYTNTFRKLKSAPETVTVISSGGGSDTVQCSN